jgi:hypothetical protein
VAAAALVGVALASLATLRRQERERRLVARLREKESLPFSALSEDERATARGLERSGVVRLEGRRVSARPGQLAAFRLRHVRFLVSGFFVAALLVSVVVVVFMRR